jgi:hypothetical protein
MSASPHARDRIFRNGLALKLIAGLIALFAAASLIIFFKITDLPVGVALLGSLTLWFPSLCHL